MMQLPDQNRLRRRIATRDRVLTAHQMPAGPAAAPPSQDFLETLRKLWRHRGAILVSLVVCGGVAAAVALSLPPRYVAEARVQVGIPSMRVMNVESLVADVSPDADRVQNEALAMQSRDLAGQVVDRLNLTASPEFNPALAQPPRWRQYLDPARYMAMLPGDLGRVEQEASVPPTPEETRQRVVDMLLAHIDVSVLGRSHVLSIKAEAAAPATASTIANTVATLYLDRQRQDKIDAASQAEKYLQGRIAELREQVQKSETAIEEYRRRYGLYVGASTGVTSQQMTEINSQLIVAQTARAQADAKLREAEALKGAGGESMPDVLNSPLIQSLKQQLAEAERKLAEASSSFGNRHPQVVAARAEVGSLRSKVSAEVAKTIDSLRREARTAASRYEMLNQNFERTKQQMGGDNDRMIRLGALERDAAVDRNLLESMLARVKQTGGQEAIQQPNARMISSAAPPGKASYPPKALLVFLGCAGGLLIGAALALVRDGVDRSFRRADQIEGMTGFPVLAMVPQLTGRGGPLAHVLRKPISPYSEALRKLFIGIELSETAQSPKTIMFSSATPAEGKSVLVASLARLLASTGKRVLLIDCDWRCPSQHQLFRCPNRHGLAALLGDEEITLNDAIHNDALSGLDVMVAGPSEPRGIQMLASQRMQQILNSLADRYDVVLLDTPPTLVGAEVLTLSRMVDKVVFAVRWGKTRQEVAMEAMKQIVDARGDIAGVVMTRVIAKEYRRYAHGQLEYQYARQALARGR